MSVSENLLRIKEQIPSSVTLVAVSKTKPNLAILEAYNTGHRIFGENKVQELVEKSDSLPKDIEWHVIGHLQTNKVRQIAPFVSLIHAVDSEKLLKEIDKKALQNNRKIRCLLQVKIAEEDSKFGLTTIETTQLLQKFKNDEFPNVKIEGLMGMATNTEDTNIIKKEFNQLKQLFDELNAQENQLTTLSMGMSGDYQLAITEGSTMVRVGSSIFGERNYH